MQPMTTIRQQKENTFVLQLLIVLASMNFLGHGSILFLLASVYELFRRKCRLLLDSNTIFVVLFSLFAFIACIVHYSASACLKTVNFTLMYLIGYNGYRQSADPQKFAVTTAFSICLGFGLELLLMYCYNLGQYRETVRTMYSIWTGESIAVTLLGLLVSAVIGFSFYAFFCTKRPILKVIVALLLVAGIWISIDTATRTPLLLLVVVYAVMGILYLRNKRGVKYLRVLFSVILVLGLLVALYQSDFIGMKTFFMDTPLYKRFESSGIKTTRAEIMKEFLVLMPKHPWGGLEIGNIVGIQAHNFLQEGYDLYGFFAFIPLLIISIQIIVNFVKLAVKKNKTNIDFLLTSMYLALFLQMCLEPVFNGYPILVWAIFLIHGIASAYLHETDSRRATLLNEGSV